MDTEGKSSCYGNGTNDVVVKKIRLIILKNKESIKWH